MKLQNININDTKIETARLVLRPFTEEDANDLYEYAQVPGVGEASGWKHHETLEHSKAVLNALIAGRRTFAVAEKETGKVIGSVGLEQCPEVYNECNLGANVNNIGYVIGQNYWGLGYANEIIRGILSYAFYILHLDAVTCAHFKDNKTSKEVLENSGFKCVVAGKYKTQSGGEYDALFYAITNADFGVDYKVVEV